MTISKTGLLKEVIKRTTSTAPTKPITLNENFPAQNAFVEDTSRFIAAQCSRRAGKTNGLALRFFRTMAAHPKSQCLYLSLTQESARGIMWDVMRDMNDLYGIGCTFKESKLEVHHPNGARLKLMGADLKDYRRKLKGRKFPGAAIDEAQDFSSEQLQSLIDDVLTPSITDYADGWLALTGTPGPVPQGYFFDVTQNKKYGYSHHEWTMLENPHMPDPAGTIADIMKKREWDEDHPSLLREYRNKWVLDVESLWIRYNEQKNHYQELPKGVDFQYIMGIDVGYNDADAIAILAWSEKSPTTYLVEELITRKQGVTELAEQISALSKKYNVYKMVIDSGGLGKKVAEEITRRWGLPLIAADKIRKQENVELLNDALRTGKFKAKAKSHFALDSYLIQVDWDRTTPDKIVIKKKPHSDIIDAVLYSFKESYSYTHEPEVPKLQYGSKAWADAQSQEMWEKELDGYQKQEEYGKWLKGED